MGHSAGRHLRGFLPIFGLAVVLTLLAAYLSFGGILFDRIEVTAAHHTPGNVIRNNIESGRDATALFYAEVEGWGGGWRGNRIRRQKAEGRRQKAEGRRQKAEGRRQCTAPRFNSGSPR